MHFFYRFLLIAGCLGLTLTAEAQLDSALIQRIDALFAFYDRSDGPGCALGIIRDGQLIYARGYGLANLDYDVPITADSKFYIASTSKQFTAACIALLVQQGTIRLDDDIRTYIPEIPDYGQVVTIDHLLHHTSGIRDYLALMNLSGRSFEDYFGMIDAIRIISRQRALNFAPGEEFLYSNSGYLLLAEVVNRVSGMSIRQFARKHFFDPLGMTNTFFNNDHQQVIKDRVVSYRPNWPHGYYQFIQHFDALGDGNLLTTVNDLYRWDQNFYTGQVGGSDFLTLLHTPGILNNGDTLNYAFGLRLDRYRGLPTVSHGGSMLGFRTQLLRFPEQRFSVIVLANVSNANPDALAYQVADLLLADQLAPRPAENRPAGGSNGNNNRPAFDASSINLSDYTGDYYSEELDATYHIFMENGALRFRIGYQEARPLSMVGSDRASALFGEFAFQRAEGRVTGFLLSSGRVKGLVFERQ